MDPRCGTNTGYLAHYRRKEKACRPCLDAHYQKVKQWKDNNPKYTKSYQAEYYQENYEQIRERKMNLYQENIDVERERKRMFHKLNPDIARASSRRRRARLMNVDSEHYSTSQVIELYGTNCHICSEPIDMNANCRPGQEGWERGLNIDHITPISKGGTDTLNNVKPSHAKCNLSKGSR